MKRDNPVLKKILLLLILLGGSLFSAEGVPASSGLPERKTYLPEYRMARLFPTDVTGLVPFYTMDPFPEHRNSHFDRKKILPADYRHSRGEALLGSFSEVLYFALRFAEGQMQVEEQDRVNLAYLGRLRDMYGTDLALCLAGSSREFLPAVEEESRRKETVRALDDLMGAYGLQGIDLDWEFPRNDREKEIHRLFMEDLRAMTSRSGRSLSMAVSHARPLPAATYALADRINLMTYDFHGKHSTWEGTLDAMEIMMIRHAVPPEKLLIGIPFYGRIFDGFSPEYWKKSQSYLEIVRDYAPLPQEDEAGGYFFNGPVTVRNKLALAAERSLQGVFIWEIGQDIPTASSLSRVVLDFDP